VLAQIRFVERTDHAELARRLAAGTIIAAIVGVAAVDHGGEAALAREGREPRVELVLAVVAAVGRIRAVVGVVELRGPDHFVAQRNGARGADRESGVAMGIGGAGGGDADGAIAEDARGGDGEKRAVYTAAIGHHDRSEGLEPGLERGGLGRVHSSQSSFSESSSLASSRSSSSSNSSSSPPSVSSSSSSSSSSESSSSTGDVPVPSRFEPQSGQLIKSPLSTSNSSTSISASHSGQVAIHAPTRR